MLAIVGISLVGGATGVAVGIGMSHIVALRYEWTGVRGPERQVDKGRG